MARKSKASRRKWWMVASVLGVSIVGISLLMRPSPSRNEAGDATNTASTAGLQILPQNPLTFHALRVGGELAAASQMAALGGIHDPAPSQTVVWSVDGREVHRGPELAPSNFQRGSLVEARIQTTGPDGTATVKGTAVTRVGNSRPRIQSVTVQRDPDDPRWLQAHVRAIDADDDPLALEYRWTADDQPLSRAQGNRVLSNGLTPGQKVRVEVTASDGDLRSEPLKCAPVELDNHAPELESPASPRMERLDNGDLVAHMALEGRDLDGDQLRMEVVEAPSGFDWDAKTNSLSWAIVSGQETVKVTVKVTDTRGASAQRTFELRR